MKTVIDLEPKVRALYDAVLVLLHDFRVDVSPIVMWHELSEVPPSMAGVPAGWVDSIPLWLKVSADFGEDGESSVAVGVVRGTCYGNKKDGSLVYAPDAYIDADVTVLAWGLYLPPAV